MWQRIQNNYFKVAQWATRKQKYNLIKSEKNHGQNKNLIEIELIRNYQ